MSCPCSLFLQLRAISKIVIKLDRCSSNVCVLSVCQDGAHVVLYNASFLDLGKPILCMIPAVVQGEEPDTEASSPFGGDRKVIQHLELTCLQDTMNAQHAIQQFHLSLDSVIPAPPPATQSVALPLGLPAGTTPVSLNGSESVNPFDALAETKPEIESPAVTTQKPAADVNSLLLSMLKGKSPEAHLLHSNAVDNFPYFALQKPEAKPTSPEQPASPPIPFPSDSGSGFSAPVAQPTSSPVPSSTESRQQGLRIIDFLKNGAKQEVPSAPLTSPLPADVNPFDDVVVKEAVITASVSGGKKKDKKQKPAVAAHVVEEPPATSATLDQRMLSQIQATVSTECKIAVEEVLKKDRWKDEMCAQMSNDLKAELTTAIGDVVREGIKEQLKESVKAYLGKSFKTAFETTLVPAFQVGTAVLHTQLQENFEHASKAMADATTREATVLSKLDEMQAELVALRSTVSYLSSELSVLKSGAQLSQSAHITTEYENDPLVLLGQGRLCEAVECALEKKSIAILLAVLKNASADSVLACCNKVVVVCVIQQLAYDLSLNDPEEGVTTRLDWLKELVMAVVSGDVERKMSIDGGDLSQSSGGISAAEAACTTILQGVFDCLKKAELRISPTGSIRTDLRMLCSLVKNVE